MELSLWPLQKAIPAEYGLFWFDLIGFDLIGFDWIWLDLIGFDLIGLDYIFVRFKQLLKILLVFYCLNTLNIIGLSNKLVMVTFLTSYSYFMSTFCSLIVFREFDNLQLCRISVILYLCLCKLRSFYIYASWQHVHIVCHKFLWKRSDSLWLPGLPECVIIMIHS